MLIAVIDRAIELWSFSFLRPFTGRMGRESRAIAVGQRVYALRTLTPQQSSAALRRAIHRIEKGLLMRPRQAIFALDYIVHAVDAYVAATRSGELFDQTELAWATDVLTEYFQVVGCHPRIDAARKRFTEAVPSAVSRPSVAQQTPYPYRQLDPVSVNFDALQELAAHRKSVRWFLEKEVTKDLIEQAASIAALAPSACNRQPYLFRAIIDPVRARQVASISMGTSGYAQNIPALVVVLGDFGVLEHSRDRHLPYIDGSLAAMQFMLALETLGLASCPINWPDVETLEKKMDRALNLPVHLRPIMLIAVGYPDPEGMVAYSARKNPTGFVRFDDDYEI